MRMHRSSWALAAALLASCGDYGAPDEVTNGVVAYTQGKPGFDFGSLPNKTYVIDPTVEIKEDTDSTTEPIPSQLLTTITDNMTALGYTRVIPASGSTNDVNAALAAADVGLRMSVLKGTGAVYYPGYWCDYWYYYSCYYSWNYAGSYSFGTVVLEMGDLTTFSPPPAAPPTTPLTILWTSMVYGVATTPAWDIPRVQEGLNRAFGQSPYLKTN